MDRPGEPSLSLSKCRHLEAHCRWTAIQHQGQKDSDIGRVIEKAVAIKIVDSSLFNVNKSVLKNQYFAKLQDLGMFMEKNPNIRLVLAGYTDSVGSEGYNIYLSRKRSESVSDYLMAHSKIDKNRVTLQWYGKVGPVASNQTEEGRASNRRVSVILNNMESFIHP